MRTAVWTAGGGLDIVQGRTDPAPGEGWAVVRVRDAGICGSDLHTYRGPGAAAGTTPGHEVAGIVEAVGAGVALAPGTAVAVEPVAGCGTCRHCREANPWHCRESVFFGGPRAAGGLADLMAVPGACLHPLPATVPVSDGALAEPLAVCVRGVAQAGVEAGHRVLILGAGTIGLCAIVAAREAGAAEVFITARHESQRAMARALGADDVFGSAEEASASLTGGRVDSVIETVGGTAETIREAVMLASPGAGIVLLGVFSGEPRLPAVALTLKEVRLMGSICYGIRDGEREFGRAVEMLGRHYNALAPLVTHRFPLERVEDAFATAADKSTGSIKVPIEP